jgi:hypothetical protein
MGPLSVRQIEELLLGFKQGMTVSTEVARAIWGGVLGGVSWLEKIKGFRLD